MVILVGIIAGLIFAWVAIRMGLYVTWSVMFNLVISIYTAISLGPVVADKLPLEGGFGAAVILVGLAAAVFTVLQGTCYLFITSQYEMSFPKLFDSVTSGIIGFLAGMLIISFLNLPFGIIRQGLSAENNYEESSQLGNSAYLDFWYNAMHSLVGTKENTQTEKLVAEIIKNTNKTKKVKATTKAVEAVEVVEPNEPEVEKVIKDGTGEPPEFDFDKI
jgi:hypothetical protein